MNEITHRTVDTNGIRMHVAEQGTGPLVILCHGFPESWYSWRHQLAALAAAGFHTVAVDMRGLPDPRAYSASGDALEQRNIAMVSRSGGLLAQTTDPETLPAWLTATDVEFYAAEFSRTGFRSALNWYRNIDRNWELLAPFAGAVVTVPALYVAGDRDLVVRFPGMEQLIANLSTFVPRLRRTIMLPGCGHWTQQERAREVNDAMLEFLEAI